MAVKVQEKKYGFKGIILFILAVLIIICSIMAGIILSDSRGVKIAGSTKITVSEGDGSAAVAYKLKESGIIKYPLVFRLESKTGGYDGRFLPGDAEITSGMSYKDILELMVSDNRNTAKITIPEGFTIKQIRDRLNEAGLIDADKFDAALNPDDYNYRFLENLPERENRMEGYLFPATYYISEGMSEHDIIDMMLKEFDVQFKNEYYSRAKELNLTVDEVITMASIIEAETDSDTERAKVAGVFYNRLKSGMKFQSCATVQYVLGERKAVLSVADTQIDSPYNTYLHSGFPIGPICNPETACIEAALYPEDTDAYYFVLGQNGEHIFSKTYEEHAAAMNNAKNGVDNSAISNEDSKKQ